MPTDPKAADVPAPDATASPGGTDKGSLTPAAERALAEAAARRAAAEAGSDAPKEIAGRGGLDPTRYGDWEINGLTADF